METKEYDYGNPEHKIHFDTPEKIEAWKKKMNFKTTIEPHECDDRVCIKTTITINGKEMYHSIDDQPAYMIIEKEFLETGFPDESKWELGDAPYGLQVWASFGMVHRTHGPARIIYHTSSNTYYIRLYAQHGKIFRENGPIFEAITSSYGDIYDIQLWGHSESILKVEIEFKYGSPVSEDIILHREHGPAHICIARGKEAPRQKQHPVDLDAAENSFGPFPKYHYYLNGKNFLYDEYVKLCPPVS